MDIEQIKKLSEKFRRAIERCERSELPLSLENFPIGSCSDASTLLGTYLKDNGFGDFHLVKGRRGEGAGLETHFWLEKENLIVDITADQFDGIKEDIIITSTDSEWHNSFTKIILREADYRQIVAMDVRRNLDAVYDFILSNIEI